MPRIPHLDATLRARGRRHLLRADAKLAAVVRRAGECTLSKRGDPYRYLVRSILYQQLAGAAALTIDRRFRASFGGRTPAPAVLARAAPARLRKLGLSRQKAAAVRSIARAFRDGEVRARALFWMRDEDVIEAVLPIRGVGEWTAHMLLMFSLGRPDVLPTGDYGVRKGAQLVYGLRELPTPQKLEALAAPWRPYRSMAAWYLWRALDLQTPE